jgi:hypothetical protein
VCPCKLKTVESVCVGFSKQAMKISLLSRSLPSRVLSWCRDCGQVMDGHVPCLNNQHRTRHLIVLEHEMSAGARKESLYSMNNLTAPCMTCASENYGKNEQWLSEDSKKSKFFHLPTDAQLNCLKNNFKTCINIDIKTVLASFGLITIIRERIIRSS